MQIERDDLLKQTKKIIKHLRVSGGIFGDSNITSEDNIYRSMSKSLVPMGEYCEENSINVTELDSIKLMVFSLPYIKKNDPAMNSERYIYSILKMLEQSYNKKIDFDKQINNSTKVCDKLFCNGNITVVYGYIKGFQEALEYTNNQ
ncbi:hypothetical protein SPONL_1894 [uncultured Candidatus Thioglobus sp.]|nr:hypothetical protein SPONL_1894 [uncultured Candidatus Thioglobus sp.]